MIRPSIIILLAGLALAEVDDKWWAKTREALKAEYLDDNTYSYDKKWTPAQITQYTTDQIKFIYSVFRNEVFADLTFKSKLGKGSYGTVFEGVRKDNGQSVSVKFMFQDDKDYSDCVKTYKTYQKLASVEGVKYIINIEEPKFFHIGNLYACTMTMEKGTDTTKPMFSSTDTNLRENTRQLVEFLVKLLEGFYTINFIAHFYHGDVKPGNILFLRTDKGIEPRIIDFDLIYKKQTDHYNPGNIIYTLDYRPPELRALVRDTNPTTTERAKLKEYLYDADYREESWSVGTTLKKIISTNENTRLILSSDSKLIELRGILDKMTSSNIGPRICTEVAYNLAKTIVAERRRII